MDQNNNLVPLNNKVADDCIPASTIFPDEAAYLFHDSFKLTKAILKCQLDIFEKIDSVLASLQEQLRQEALSEMPITIKNFYLELAFRN